MGFTEEATLFPFHKIFATIAKMVSPNKYNDRQQVFSCFKGKPEAVLAVVGGGET